MKFTIPDDWLKKWAQIESEDQDGGATVPINRQRIAEYAARAASKRVAMDGPEPPASGAGFVKLCIYERRHGTFATLGGQVLFGPLISPTGKPSRTYKIHLSYLRGIIEHAVRTGEPE